MHRRAHWERPPASKPGHPTRRGSGAAGEVSSLSFGPMLGLVTTVHGDLAAVASLTTRAGRTREACRGFAVTARTSTAARGAGFDFAPKSFAIGTKTLSHECRRQCKPSASSIVSSSE